jgi:glycerophosphoryl diester phosphodiesterase
MHPFLSTGGPIGFAHRGGASEAPENTLPAFDRAVKLGYRYLETDVYRTRDGVLVAFHDPRLDATTDCKGAIAELTIDMVEEADAGYAFTPDGGRTFPFRGRGVRVPRLAHLMRRFPEARFNIDPKADASVDPLVALIDELGAWGRVAIGAFSDRRIERIRRVSAGRACTAMGPRAVALARASATLLGQIPRLGADCIQVPRKRGRIEIVTPRFVEAARRAGLPVHVWTVNDEATMHALLDIGVDGIMTDELALLRTVFASKHLPPVLKTTSA